MIPQNRCLDRAATVLLNQSVNPPQTIYIRFGGKERSNEKTTYLYRKKHQALRTQLDRNRSTQLFNRASDIDR